MIFLLISTTLSFDSILTRPELKTAQVGVYVLNLDNDRVVYSYNKNKVFIPASNMKIITSGAALYYLGHEYRFKTRLAIRGRVENNKVHGDILIIGGGDPWFGLKDLQQFVDKLTTMGIDEITGNIIVDDRLFTDERLPMGWSRHYFDAHYAPEISALSMNRNCISVRIEATGIGALVKATIEPETRYVKLINRMITKPGDDSIVIYRKEETNIIYLEGGIGAGHKRNIPVAIIEPALFVGFYFKERLEDSHIGFEGRLVKERDSYHSTSSVGRVYEDKVEEYFIDSIVSLPLIEILKETNTESVNLNAEIILKALGRHLFNEGSFVAGLQALKGFLAACGTDTAEISLWDGSGLSRHNLISAHDLVMVLRFIFHTTFFKDIYGLLPAPGEGTLERRLKNFRYTMRGKTGTLYAVSCLSGYLNVGGINYCFSLMFNNFTCPRERIEVIQEEILNALGAALDRDGG